MQVEPSKNMVGDRLQAEAGQFNLRKQRRSYRAQHCTSLQNLQPWIRQQIACLNSLRNPGLSGPLYFLIPPPSQVSDPFSTLGCHFPRWSHLFLGRRQDEGQTAQRLTHLMSVQNCKNDGFLSTPTEKRGTRRAVQHALGIHLVQEATSECSPGWHSSIWIRTEGNLRICMDASLPIICES